MRKEGEDSSCGDKDADLNVDMADAEEDTVDVGMPSQPVPMSVIDEDLEAQGEYVESIDVSGQLQTGADENADEYEMGDDGRYDQEEEGGEGNDGDAEEGEEEDEEDEDYPAEELTGFEVYDDDDDEDDDGNDGEDEYEVDEDDEDEGNYL